MKMTLLIFLRKVKVGIYLLENNFKVGNIMPQRFCNFNNIFNHEEHLSLSLLNSEGFYWLTSAVAIAFANEELLKYQEIFPHVFDKTKKPMKSEPLIKLFQESVKSNVTSDNVKQEAQKAVLYNIEILVDFMKNSQTFDPVIGLISGKTMATYWLIYKLIELEWQQILNFEEIKDTYLLLDMVILDHSELERLEGNCLGNNLSQDDLVFLRSYWDRVKYFWANFQEDLQLLSSGHISFTTSYKKK